MTAITPTAYQRACLSMPEDLNLLLAGGRGGGKALDRETPIPTPSGWSLLKDIVVGDKVFDEHGRQCFVTGVFDSVPEKAYRLTFSDGTYLDACDEHQWVTWTHAQRKYYLRHDKSPTKGLPENWANAPVRTTQEIVDTLTHSTRGDTNHCIPLAGALSLPEVALPVDPYLLGVWLGDGTANNGNITTMDVEVVQAFTTNGFELSVRQSKGKATTYAIVGPVAVFQDRFPDAPKHRGPREWSTWRQDLDRLGMIQNKHIPSIYLRASKEQRLSLLQGLMDSDGTAVTHNSQVSFSNTNRFLAAGVAELARSLGEKPTLIENRAKLYGKDCGPVWDVAWTARLPCFRISRKLSILNLARICGQQSRHKHRMIVSAEPIAPMPMRCLTVDSENHMYLAGEGMIPTHNSTLIRMILLKHAEKYGPLCKELYVRETYDALTEIEQEFEMMLDQLYTGKGKVHHNKTDGHFQFPNGAQVTFGQISEGKHYSKYQGRSFSQIICDEYGAVKEPKWINLLFSNIRGPAEVPKRVVLAANPGGAQHGTLHYDYISKAPPWTPYDRGGELWANCPSTWRDNPTIDQSAYLRKLKAACGNDEALFKAWDTGDWNIARGAYFAGCLDERVHMLTDEQFPIRPLERGWQPYVGMDWGSGAPCISYIAAESPGVPGFPKGSLILCDELALHEPNDLNVGLNWPPSKLADALKEMCARWGCPPEGVGDDAYGLQDTLLETLAEHGVYFVKPRKERVAGWQEMRLMLTNAQTRNGMPGLWISERCKYFWRTAPFVQRDEKRPEDIMTTGPDHGCDAARYTILHRGHGAFTTKTTGQY